VHEWAQEQLLYGATRVTDNNGPTEEVVTRYLDVLDVTADPAAGDDDTAVLVTLHDRLRDVERRLDTEWSGLSEQLSVIMHELPVLLHICVLHTPPNATESEANKLARGNLLLALCSLLVHPKAQTQPPLTDYIFDLASALGDSLPEETLSSLARPSKSPDPRIQGILGSNTSAVDNWLALASQVQPTGTAQQRALAKHTAQQGQSSGRSSMMAQSPVTPTQQAQQRAWPMAVTNRVPVEMKTTLYALRKWEIIPDPTPVMGENDTSLSLGLFGARKT